MRRLCRVLLCMAGLVMRAAVAFGVFVHHPGRRRRVQLSYAMEGLIDYLARDRKFYRLGAATRGLASMSTVQPERDG